MGIEADVVEVQILQGGEDREIAQRCHRNAVNCSRMDVAGGVALEGELLQSSGKRRPGQWGHINHLTAGHVEGFQPRKILLANNSDHAVRLAWSVAKAAQMKML